MNDARVGLGSRTMRALRGDQWEEWSSESKQQVDRVTEEAKCKLYSEGRHWAGQGSLEAKLGWGWSLGALIPGLGLSRGCVL